MVWPGLGFKLDATTTASSPYFVLCYPTTILQSQSPVFPRLQGHSAFWPANSASVNLAQSGPPVVNQVVHQVLPVTSTGQAAAINVGFLEVHYYTPVQPTKENKMQM